MSTDQINDLNLENDDDEDEFYDALSSCSDELRSFEMDFDSSLKECQLAVCYFFNNKFDDAQSIILPYANTSIYHSLGSAVFGFLEAILTFEQQQIFEASEKVKICLEVCQRFRRNRSFGESIGKRFRRGNLGSYTDKEAHAELCYAEALLLKTLLNFIEDESLSSFISGGMKIRQCFNMYKECALILQQKSWESSVSKNSFESGVCMGLGAFNLMISLLPSGVTRILEFIGFSGNKKNGIDYLKRGYELPGLRQILCGITLLGYNSIVCYALSNQEGDLELCDKILNFQLKKYPQGVWFLFFKGRIEFMKCNLDDAIVYYKMSWHSQNNWPQFHHVTFWELFWVHCLQLDWQKAKEYANFLLEKSKWSRTVYSYQKASAMLMSDTLSEAEMNEIDTLLSNAPLYKQRIGGKSLPMEKFVCKKVSRYMAQNKFLCLPALELMYLMNTFRILRLNVNLADTILLAIEKRKKEYLRTREELAFGYDNYALCLLLLGACCRHMKQYTVAIRHLNECLSLEKLIVDDKYIVPYAHYEKGMIFLDEKKFDVALSLLGECRKKYSGYTLESRLQFRIHTALMEIKENYHKTDNN